VAPVSVLMMVMPAPEIAAPLESVTVPVMLPAPEVWAERGRPGETRKRAVTAKTSRRWDAVEGFIGHWLLKAPMAKNGVGMGMLVVLTQL
jgi:hypothetical protein